MKKLYFFLLIAIFLPACGGKAPAGDYKFRSHIDVGEISGPDDFRRELKSRASGRGALVLSGRASMDFHEYKGDEKVWRPIYGPEREVLKPDPFTRQIWTVEEPSKSMAAESVPLQGQVGEMVFDWVLADSAGRTIRQGRLTENSYRLLQGYALKGTRPKSPAALEKEQRDYLRETAADKIVLILGREPGTMEIDGGQGPELRRARELAAQKKWDEARDIWLSIVEQNPSYSPALYDLGLYYEREADLPKAYDLYQRAFLAGGGDAKIRQALTRLIEAKDLDRQQGLRP